MIKVYIFHYMKYIYKYLRVKFIAYIITHDPADIPN